MQITNSVLSKFRLSFKDYKLHSPCGLVHFLSLKNMLVLIYTEFHSKSSYYLYLRHPWSDCFGWINPLWWTPPNHPSSLPPPPPSPNPLPPLTPPSPTPPFPYPLPSPTLSLPHPLPSPTPSLPLLKEYCSSGLNISWSKRNSKAMWNKSPWRREMSLDGRHLQEGRETMS